MSALIVTYDLSRPKREYHTMFNVIRGADRFWNHIENTWIIKSKDTPEQWRVRLVAHLKPGDKLIVLRVDLKDIQGCLPQTSWGWFDS